MNLEHLMPLGAQVLVKFDEPDAYYGKIIIPNQHRDAATTGTVLAIGPKQTDVKVGDRIIFSKHAGVPVQFGFQQADTAMLARSEVLGLIEADDPPMKKRITTRISMAMLEECLVHEGILDPTPAEFYTELVYLHLNHQEGEVYITTEMTELPF